MDTEPGSLLSNLNLELEARVDDPRWQDEKIFQNIYDHSLVVAKTTLSTVFFNITNNFSVNLSLLLSNNQALKELNFTFRQIDKATNVLSFPTAELKKVELSKKLQCSEKVFLGDIAISFDKIEEEWLEYTNSFQNHYNHMLIHGILHLCGFDHQNDAEAEIMEKLEQEILAKIIN